MRVKRSNTGHVTDLSDRVPSWDRVREAERILTFHPNGFHARYDTPCCHEALNHLPLPQVTRDESSARVDAAVAIATAKSRSFAKMSASFEVNGAKRASTGSPRSA